jgi:hypothetical protein
MARLFRCSPGLPRPFVFFTTIAWALCSLAWTLNADDLKGRPALPRRSSSPDGEPVFRALGKETTVEFLDLPLEDGLTFLKEYHNISLRVDRAASATAKIQLDSPVTLKLSGAPLQGTLEMLLEPLGLDSYVDGSELVVTTRAAAAAAVRSRLAKILQYEIAIIDHLCELTEAQKQKLELAGRGDVERLFEGVAKLRTKIPSVQNDEKKLNKLLRDMAQLKQKFESGPFGRGAMFRKAVDKALTPEQDVQYEPIREVLQRGGLVGTVERGRDVVLGVVLIGEGFSDEILAPLKRLTSLGSLILAGTKVTDAGIADLHRAVPALKIAK